LLELMGGKTPGLPGQSLVPVIQGKARRSDGRQAQREVFIQWNRSEGTLAANLPHVTPEDVARVRDAPIRTVITQEGWNFTLHRRRNERGCRCARDIAPGASTVWVIAGISGFGVAARDAGYGSGIRGQANLIGWL
jgi:hypothetical protein